MKKDRGIDASSLDSLMLSLEKKYGSGVCYRIGDRKPVKIDVIGSGSLGLDIATGVGGIPRGRVVEAFGPESCGKTTLGLSIIAMAQRKGGVAAFIDAEQALDITYAKKIGVDTKKMYFSQPDSGEDGLEIVEALAKSRRFHVIVVDSVASLLPRVELEGEIGDRHMGTQARMMSQALRKLVGVARKSNTSIVFINQTRMKIGRVFGNPETTPGGLALKFHASLRIAMHASKRVKESGLDTGRLVNAKIVKNKLAPPFRFANFTIVYGKGIDRVRELADMALDLGILRKKKNSMFFEGDKMASNYLKLLRVLRKNIKFRKHVRRAVLKISEKIFEESV